jgi:hypothetical protein
MNPTLVRAVYVASEVAVLAARPSSSACSSVATKSTEIVPDASEATLQAIIRGKAAPESVLHTDGWRGYDDFDKHLRIQHG